MALSSFGAPTLTTAHAQLRAATRPLHDRLEAVVGLPDSVGCAEDYRVVLARFLGFHEPLEAALAQAPWREFDFDPRRRAACAVADLQALGFDAAATAAVERRAATPFGDAATAFGVLYVLEGSTLGGQVIARGLRHALGAEAHGALRFFAGRGVMTGPMWRSFLDALEGRAATPAERAAACAAAERTFTDMIDWFG